MFLGLPEDKVSALIMYQKSADAGNEQAKLQLDKFIATAAVEEWKCTLIDIVFVIFKHVSIRINLS